MLSVCWLLAAVVVYVCSPAVGSVELCWDSAACNDLSSKNSLRICFHLCPSVFLSEYPGLSALVQSSDEENLSLAVLLASLTSRGKVPESDPSSRSEERRASYAMEHFRWGKPAPRKRKPMKVYSIPLLQGDDPSFDLQTRRQVGSSAEEEEEEEDGGNNGGSSDLQRLSEQEETRESFTPKPTSLLIPPQDRNVGTYRMSHFRWSSPTANKRFSGFAKPWEKTTQKPVSKKFRNIISKAKSRNTFQGQEE